MNRPSKAPRHARSVSKFAPGKTAQIEADSLSQHCIRNGARHLENWIEVHEEMYPGKPHSIPDPAEVGLHRLGGGGLFITDTCAQALCFRRLLISMVAAEVQKQKACRPTAAGQSYGLRSS